jgi:rSAM/selenodomain-associated transferase 1
MGSIAVAIICKTPMAGQSKTRLAPPLRPDECAAISACFIADLADTVATLERPARPYVVYTPLGSEPALSALLPPGFGLVPQGTGDLGARLLRGIADLLAAGHDGAILINSDSPTLPPAILGDAVAALTRGDPLVLAPAHDGGYTLIGLRSTAPRLFEDIAWSTETVFETTLERAREIAMPATVLDSWYDIDDAGSFAMLEAELDGTPPGFARADLLPRDAPRTRAFVEGRRRAVPATCRA